MKIVILVTKIKDESSKIEKTISNDSIFPIFNEIIIIDIKDYKINLNDIKNNNKKENILLNKFEEEQKIKLNEIKCNICEINNKANTVNNEFFICNTCNKNICPLCMMIRIIYVKIIMNYLINISKNAKKIYEEYAKMSIQLMKFLI